MADTFRMITDLCEAHGPSGYEGPVRDVVRGYLDGFAELSTDKLGSLIARKVGDAQGPKVMLAGHLDEIGLMVTRIDEKGYVFFQTIGGWWEQVMLAQRVAIRTRRGMVTGVVGSKPPHVLGAEERQKIVETRRMFIDVGVKNRAEAETLGIEPGDPITPICPTERMGDPDYVVAKAWDNRYGCAVVIDVLQGLKGAAHPNVVYGVATVQEEVGLRGARTAAQSIQPDVAFSLDVGIAGDVPGVEDFEATTKLGNGPTVVLYDGSMIPNQGLRRYVHEVASQEGIPVQHDALVRGGTDGGQIHLVGGGVPTVVIGVPTRYIHSAASVFHMEDYRNAVKLVAALVRRLDRATVDGFTA
ncbi:MAG: M42 family metallopeptidase [Thermaerobacter sp.]|nr:M42 family metallopeptidase [Thermaerobacter sp.]